MPKKGQPPRSWCIPIEPIRRVLSEWIAREGAAYDQTIDREHFGWTKQLTPMARIAESIWPGAEYSSSKRRLHSILFEQNTIDFDLADRILCALDLTHLWVTEPDLCEVYETASLPALDIVRPTSDIAFELACEPIRQLRESGMTRRLIAETVGVGYKQVDLALRGREFVA